MSRILVTDGEQRSSLALVRSLGAAGHELHVCAGAGGALAGASRYCRSAHVVPDAASDPTGFTAAIEELVADLGIETLVPMTDPSASLLLSLRKSHTDLTIPFPAEDAYHAISDKRRLLESAAELGVPVPRQIVVDSPAESPTEASRRCAELGMPLVVKPARSAVLTPTGMLKQGVRMAPSEAALIDALSSYPPEAYPLLVQECITGPGIGAFMLFSGGRTIASFGHQRLREKPPTGGVSVYRESIRLPPEVAAYAELILEHFGWNGVAMVEFKQDASTGTPYLMEVNGRFWGSLQLAVDAGVDFPSLLLRTSMGEEVEPVTTYRVGVRSRWFWGDVDHLLWILRASTESRSVNPSLPGRLTALGRFLVLWRPGDRWEVIRLNDFRPFLAESRSWFRALRK